MTRVAIFGLMILGLAILLGIGAGNASAQFRVAPGPSGGFGGAGAYGAGGSLGGLGSPGLGNDLGNSGLGNLPLPQNSYGPTGSFVVPSYPAASSATPDFSNGSSSTSGYSGASPAGSPPPPDEARWSIPHVAAPASDQSREDTASPSSHQVGYAPEKPIKPASTQPSGWRWKWWHGLIVLVIIGLVMAAQKK